MSANNWTACPRCQERHDAALAEQARDVAELYGKVPAGEWDTARQALAVAEANGLDYTFREDYEIGIYDGVFTTDYHGGCEVCGLTYDFKHTGKVIT